MHSYGLHCNSKSTRKLDDYSVKILKYSYLYKYSPPKYLRRLVEWASQRDCGLPWAKTRTCFSDRSTSTTDRRSLWSRSTAVQSRRHGVQRRLNSRCTRARRSRVSRRHWSSSWARWRPCASGRRPVVVVGGCHRLVAGRLQCVEDGVDVRRTIVAVIHCAIHWLPPPTTLIRTQMRCQITIILSWPCCLTNNKNDYSDIDYWQ